MTTPADDIRMRLIGSLLSEWCLERQGQNPGFFHVPSWNSTYKLIRFLTNKLRDIFPSQAGAALPYSGSVMGYQVDLSAEPVTLACLLFPERLHKKDIKAIPTLLSATRVDGGSMQTCITLASWRLGHSGSSASEITSALSKVLELEAAYFESELLVWKSNPLHRIRTLPAITQEQTSQAELPDILFIEGARKEIITNRYERSPQARARCIAYHGTACKVCGFDFGIAYGEAFSGLIEVHHIVPLSTINAQYQVNPVHDLIPVCSNCHMAIHQSNDPEGMLTKLRAAKV